MLPEDAHSRYSLYLLARCYESQRLHCDGDVSDLSNLTPGTPEYKAVDECIELRCAMLAGMEELIRDTYSGLLRLDFGSGRVTILGPP